jgi:transposase-like protein
MPKISCARHRFSAKIIQHAVWLYFRFPLSYRDVEDLLAERGIDVSYETVRRWALKFGQAYARKSRKTRGRADDRWHLDKVFVSINGKRMYLWRAVDCEGEVLDILVQSRRNKKEALKLMRKSVKKQGFVPDAFVTDKLSSYGAALRDLGLSKHHDFGGRKNNRAENSHLPVRGVNDECNGSSRPDQLNDFSPPTLPFTIPSMSSVTSIPESSFASSEVTR